MPNWCSNTVTISHIDSELIDSIQTEVEKDDPQLFNLILPTPEDIGDGWYTWNCQNWGTKWDASVGGFERLDDNTIRISMDTAWSPPIGVYEALYEQGYDVQAYYLEEGMAFAGKYEDGMDNYCEYSNGLDNLDPDVDDFWGISERYAEDERMRAEEEWEDSCNDLERTDWYPAKIKPVTAGVYEVETNTWPYPNKIYWTGKEWQFYAFEDNCGNGFPYPNKVKQWRGVTEEAYLEGMLNEFQKSLDGLVEEIDD